MTDVAQQDFGRALLTGGVFGCLDRINGSKLNNGDTATVTVMSTGIKYFYYLNATSGAAESSPDVISPDTNAGNKRWILIGTIGQTVPTWTVGVSFGGGTTGITYSAGSTVGYYEKIGNLVHVSAFCILTNKGSSTGVALITGLPFVAANAVGVYSPPSLRLSGITFADYPTGYVGYNSTTIALEECTNAGVISSLTDADFSNNSSIMVSATYRAA